MRRLWSACVWCACQVPGAIVRTAALNIALAESLHLRDLAGLGDQRRLAVILGRKAEGRAEVRDVLHLG